MSRFHSGPHRRQTAALVSAICLFGIYVLFVGLIVYMAAHEIDTKGETVDGAVIGGVWILLSLLALPVWAALQAFLQYRKRTPRGHAYMRLTGGLAFLMTFFVLLYFLGSVLRPDGEGGAAALISAVLALAFATAGTYTLGAPKH